jgi:hypothetical protein
LPAPLILSADLRPGAPSGGVNDPEIIAILTNVEVIAINQDAAAQPMRPIRRAKGKRYARVTHLRVFVHASQYVKRGLEVEPQALHPLHSGLPLVFVGHKPHADFRSFCIVAVVLFTGVNERLCHSV